MEVFQIGYNDESRWNDLLNSSFNATYRASIASYKSVLSNSEKPQIFIFRNNGVDVAGVLYTLKRFPLNFITFGDIHGGIVFKSKEHTSYTSEIIKHYINWGKMNKVSYLRYTPWIPKIYIDNITEYSRFIDQEVVQLGFRSITEGRHTYWIDLQLDTKQLLSNVARKNRRLITRALESEMTVEVLEEPMTNHLESFWNLYSSLAADKGFKALEKEVFLSRIRLFLDKKHACMFITSYKEHVVNIYLIGTLGVATGMYGAFNSDYKKIEGCLSPGPISTWKIITELKSRGIKTYDMGFCPGKVPYKEHPRYNIWFFKYSFGGNYVQFMPTYGKILHPLRGRLFQRWRHKK